MDVKDNKWVWFVAGAGAMCLGMKLFYGKQHLSHMQQLHQRAQGHRPGPGLPMRPQQGYAQQQQRRMIPPLPTPGSMPMLPPPGMPDSIVNNRRHAAPAVFLPPPPKFTPPPLPEASYSESNGSESEAGDGMLGGERF